MPRAVKNDAEFVPNTYVLVEPGWYLAEIHEVTEIEERKGTNEEAYKVGVRLGESPYDGTDIVDGFVGLYGKSRFKLHQIVGAGGPQFAATYYDKDAHKWIAYPTEEELESLDRIYVKVENEAYQRTQPDPERPKQKVEMWLANGEPDLALANRITEYAPATGEKPEFRPSKGMGLENWTPRPGASGAAGRRTNPGTPGAAKGSVATQGGSAEDETPW